MGTRATPGRFGASVNFRNTSASLTASDGSHDVVERRSHARPFLGAILLAQGALDSVDHGFNGLAQIRIMIA